MKLPDFYNDQNLHILVYSLLRTYLFISGWMGSLLSANLLWSTLIIHSKIVKLLLIEIYISEKKSLFQCLQQAHELSEAITTALNLFIGWGEKK